MAYDPPLPSRSSPYPIPPMKLLLLFGLVLLSSCSAFFEKSVPQSAASSGATIASLSSRSIDGQEVALSKYSGRVLLVVNVASECGFTKQYTGLQDLHEEYQARGFEVLGFPSNEFGGQEPGSSKEIQTFCTNEFGVTFPLFEKVKTQPGAEQSPVYAYLGAATGKLPGWNFGKYLVDKNGAAVAFYPSTVAPADAELRAAIERELAR